MKIDQSVTEKTLMRVRKKSMTVGVLFLTRRNGGRLRWRGKAQYAWPWARQTEGRIRGVIT
jgi:hypothetical protein